MQAQRRSGILKMLNRGVASKYMAARTGKLGAGQVTMEGLEKHGGCSSASVCDVHGPPEKRQRGKWKALGAETQRGSEEGMRFSPFNLK